MALSIYNTLTRRKEEFVPLVEGRVGMYVCGPTVYGHSHIGHAKSYVSFDVIVRYLRYRGYVVTYVQNITDVGHMADDTGLGDVDEGQGDYVWGHISARLPGETSKFLMKPGCIGIEEMTDDNIIDAILKAVEKLIEARFNESE